VAHLVFDCVGARAEPHTIAPTMAFTVRIAETTGASIHAIALRCQLRIEPQRRRYSAAEAERLNDLFGDPSRWADTLKPMQFATVSTMVSTFTGWIEISLPVPCSYDLEIAAARYFHGLDDGTVPLLMLYSGTVFIAAENGFTVEPVPWSAESAYRLPVSIWQELVDRYFPNSGWIRCGRDTLDALGRYKSRHALPTWDSAVQALLAEAVTREP
jgi:Family of unknown function (DUF6084)